MNKPLTKEQFLHHYALAGKICGHNPDTARKAARTILERRCERRKVREKVRLGGVHWTIAEILTEELFRVYAKWGEALNKAWPVFAREQARTFKLHAELTAKAEEYKASATVLRPHIAEDGRVIYYFWKPWPKNQPPPANLKFPPQGGCDVPTYNKTVAALIQWMKDCGIAPGGVTAAKTIEQANGPAPIAVTFKTFEDNEPGVHSLNYNHQGGPRLILSAMSRQRGESFWRGALWGIWDLNDLKLT